VVAEIFASIEKDPRHTDLRILSRRPITERRYPDWAMGFDHPDAETLKAQLPGFHRSIGHPLVDASLIRNAELAENLLGFLASDLEPAQNPS
jgi:hypothetical protein